MQNDSPAHYGEVRFNMNKRPCMELLYGDGMESAEFSDRVVSYGRAVKTFGQWQGAQSSI